MRKLIQGLLVLLAALPLSAQIPASAEAPVKVRRQIDQLVQLNEGQPYTHDRAALISILDESLAGARPKTT